MNWVGVPRRGRPGSQPAYLDSPPSLGAAVKTPRVRGGSPIPGKAMSAAGADPASLYGAAQEIVLRVY